MHTVLAPLPTTVDETIYDAAGERLLTLTAVPAQLLLVGRWYGHIDADAVQRAVRAALAFAERHPTARCVLSDGTQVRGDWGDLLPWVGYEFLPAFMKTGIRAVAFLPSRDPLTRLAITNFTVAARDVFPVRVFDIEAVARRWLAAYATNTPPPPEGRGR